MVETGWAKRVAEILIRNDIHLCTTVPDYIVTQVLDHLYASEACSVITACREEEGLGIVSGAYLAGKRGALIMQNSGLGNCVNTLASLNVAAQIPVVLVISHRGDIDEFNPAQVPMGQALYRVLDALDIRHFTPHTLDALEAQADGLIKLAYTRSLPIAFVLPADLTGGRPDLTRGEP